MKPLPGLEVRPTARNGLGLFTTRAFRTGEQVCALDGRPVEGPNGPRFQVGPNEYIGPSGTVADAMNHSCSPNGWVQITPSYPVFALRDIAPGDEVVIDYSLNHTSEGVFFRCRCGSANCRRFVGGFGSISPWQQALYIQLGVVPPYILDAYLGRFI